MWGSSQVVNSPVLAFGDGGISQQLARINYGRPETWRFLFSATFLSFQGGAGGAVAVFFDLILGTGRGVIKLAGFEAYNFDPAADVGKTIWSAAVVSPKRSSTDAAANLIDTFSAQDIQCSARIRTGAPTTLGTVEVSAAFSPNQHTRPEWFKIGRGAEEFPGGEDHGT